MSVTPAVAGQSVTAFALASAVLAPIIATFTAALAPRRTLAVVIGGLSVATAVGVPLGHWSGWRAALGASRACACW
ncbi:hypothetical protein [Ramlibacter sp.]|uniref:hypothetical protein n=1 Tax=Ramlibacter sp. TaxID=1917967 RepID=UPI0025CDB65E|nr:hypothetical protein [Ramlibacter sp.]